jgi:hypothetical protein
LVEAIVVSVAEHSRTQHSLAGFRSLPEFPDLELTPATKVVCPQQ